MESLEIFVATTCPGWIKKELRNHESHTKDVQWEMSRRSELEKRDARRRKSTAAKAVGSAPRPKGRTGRRCARPVSFSKDIGE